jgi:hypothetical protein
MEVWPTGRPVDPYFDCQLNACILSRYGDVAAALREPMLVPALAGATTPAAPVDSAAHAEFRAQALRTLAPVRLQQWEARFVPLANRMAAALPAGRPMDLVEHFFNPWSIQVASLAADVPDGQRERLASLARRIFDAACEPYDAALRAASRQAVTELARFFHGAPPLHMQMFIALAHSLAAFLGNAWLALLAHPAELCSLRQEPSLLPGAIDELQRFAGPAKAQFRQAAAPVKIHGCTIPRGRQVILRLDIANRDADEFPGPDRLQFDGRATGHLAFGSGLHACVGAVLIKSAASAATRALLERFHFADSFAAAPVDSFAIRYVKSLAVVLRPPDQNDPTAPCPY